MMETLETIGTVVNKNVFIETMFNIGFGINTIHTNCKNLTYLFFTYLK